MVIRNSSVLGVFTGFLISTFIYIMFSSALSLTWKGTRSAGTVEILALRQQNDPTPPLVHLHHERKVSPEKMGAHYSITVEQQPRRKRLLYTIATSVDNLEDAKHKVESTWGEDASEWQSNWQMAVGSELITKKKDSDSALLATKCEDFPSLDGHMSSKQLFCLLEAIYASNYDKYRWFFLATEATYVSVYQLERLVDGLDADNGAVYMGKSHPEGYCEGGAGLVLSHTALREIVPHFQACLDLEEQGDAALGACFKTKLQETCLDGEKSSSYYVEGLPDDFAMSSGSEWVRSHRHFITASPVKSIKDMRTIHVMDLMREFDYQENRARTISKKLYSSELCKDKFVDVKVAPMQNSTQLQTWSIANPNSTYYSGHLEPREWYDGNLKMEMELVGKNGLRQINKVLNTTFVFRRVLYSFFRYISGQGREFIIDVETQSKVVKRMQVFRPHVPSPTIAEDAGLEAINKIIDFVVPLSNVNNRFVEFMKTYEDLCLRESEKCRLNLVVYGNKDLASIKSNLTLYQTKYPGAQFNIIPGKDKFSRGRALHIGISHLQKSDLAFTCDVDMTIDKGFLNRCRRNTIESRRVYYPVVFKYYDMDYVYRFEPKPIHGYDISRKHGHWCTYGYGMLCIYKSDYDEVGGYDATIEGWGGEDVLLADQVIKKGYEMMRAPDPGLSHRYHPKVCSKKLSKDQYDQCLSSRNEDIADRRRLADNIYYLENKCNVKQKIWD